MPTLTVENRSTTSPAAGSRYRRFRPRLVLGYQQDLNSLIKELTTMGTVEAGTPLDSHLPSVVPGRHHCRWLDHEHNGAAKGMRTVHDAARDRHPLTGTEHERFAPLYLELKPAL